ncbi:MAG: hypothetical protein M3Q06_13460 [Bacteroidota bacterium]|nr:hypothetical protein [Bacteroidota bacterium]
MKKNAFLLLMLFISAIFQSANAQTCDPWITQAYTELYSESATSTECNIKNYNNGSWRSYDELKGYIQGYVAKTYASFTGNEGVVLTGDPFVVRIYQKLYSRYPTAWELNIRNYNNGSWSNYTQLKSYIQAYQNALTQQGLEIKTAPYNGNLATGFFINGKQVAVNVVSAGGGNVIAAGGANAVAAGSANVVAAGSANAVAAGGANIAINAQMAGVSFSSGRTVQSAGSQIIRTSGNGAIVIR